MTRIGKNVMPSPKLSGKVLMVGIVCITLLVFAYGGNSATINVPSDYAKIQAAINAAVKGDTILVGPGTYKENISFLGKAITLLSSDGPEKTIIDGRKLFSVISFKNMEGLDSVLDGFTITNGKGTMFMMFGFPAYGGGGIYCNIASPTIRNNIISKSSASDFGGGIFIHEYCSPVITNNLITENNGGSGGGISCHYCSPSLIAYNTIINNTGDFGGGISLSSSSESLVHHNIISGNSTINWGGGIEDTTQTSIITNNYIFSNSAGDSGGGIYCWGQSDYVNNTIVGNSAGFYGGGFRFEGTICRPTITNTILWDNSALLGPELYVGGTTFPQVTISYSNIKGGMSSVHVLGGCTLNWGEGMIDQDPLFVDPLNDDYHLTFPSPCKDAGYNQAHFLPSDDFENDPRISNGLVDMGADEFHRHLYTTGDKTPGGNVQVKVVGNPQLLIWLYFGLSKLDPPAPSPYGDWHLKWPFKGPVVTFAPQNGVRVLPFTVPNNFPCPLDIYLQSFVGLDLSNLGVLEIR